MSIAYEILNPQFAAFVNTKKEPALIADGYTWTEGPVWYQRALYFNDIPGKQMLRWTAEQGVSVILKNSEYANGNTLDANGNMVSCEHGGRRVVRRSNASDLNTVDVVADRYQGNRLNSPNDVVVHHDGSIWFTDPPYGINSDVEGYPAESEVSGNYVYRVDSNGTLTVVASDFDKPNGLAFSPDYKLLYIADSGAILGASFPDLDYTRPHHVRVFDVTNNSLSNGRIFSVIEPGVPDGLRVDHEGNIWCSAQDGIHCISAQGETLGKILLPQQTSNLCFGGVSGTDIFITSSDKVYHVESSRRDAAHARP